MIPDLQYTEIQSSGEVGVVPRSHLHLLQCLYRILFEAYVSFHHRLHLLSKSLVERLRDLLRLTDAAALNDNVVELLQLREADELLEEITPKGATDATILEGNDLLLGLVNAVRLLD